MICNGAILFADQLRVTKTKQGINNPYDYTEEDREYMIYNCWQIFTVDLSKKLN